MNADRLLEAFDRLGDEAQTVKQFRKLVIGLAMSGKLAMPDEATMNLATLREQIEARKRGLIQHGALRRQVPMSAISHGDLPQGFSNPTNFVRLGDIARIEKGLTGIMKAKAGPYPLVVTAEDRASCSHFDFDGAAAIVPLVSSAGHGKASIQRLQSGRKICSRHHLGCDLSPRARPHIGSIHFRVPNILQGRTAGRSYDRDRERHLEHWQGFRRSRATCRTVGAA